MKIIINKNEISAVKNYTNAINQLVVGVGSIVENEDISNEINSIEDVDIELLNLALGEYGGSVVLDDNDLIIVIPESFTTMYMDLVTRLVETVTPEVLDMTKIVVKYKDLIVSAFNLIKLMGSFAKPVKEIQEVTNRLYEKINVFNDLAQIIVDTYSNKNK